MGIKITVLVAESRVTSNGLAVIMMENVFFFNIHFEIGVKKHWKVEIDEEEIIF